MDNTIETNDTVIVPEVADTLQNDQPNEVSAEPAVTEAVETEQSKKKLLKNPKKLLLIAIPVVAVLILIPVLLAILGNTYKTPIKYMEKVNNAKDYNASIKYTLKCLNGMTQDELEDFMDIMMRSEYYEENAESSEEFYDRMIEMQEDHYGEDYKYSFEIEDKDRLDKDSLKDFRKEIKDLGKRLESIVEETSDYDSDDWSDMADDMGLSKSQVKKLVSLLKTISKEWKSVEVTDGYELAVITTITGEELDEPVERDQTLYVYKVNGRWISGDVLEIAYQMLSDF